MVILARPVGQPAFRRFSDKFIVDWLTFKSVRLSLNDWLAEARLLNQVIVDYIDFELVLIYLLLAIEQSVCYQNWRERLFYS